MKFGTAKISRIAAFAAAALLALPLAACSAQGSAQNPSLDFGQRSGSDAAPGGVSLDSMALDMSAGSSEAIVHSAAIPEAARSVISTGNLTVEVSDPRAAIGEVTDLAESLGGYIESQSLSGSGSGDPSGANLTVRVPSLKFDEAFESIGALGTPLDENRSATDVTAQHVDLQARVESLQTSVTRLTELMEGAATTSELIEAESALAARQAELDSLTAQLEMLEAQVDESTIWVNFTTTSALPGGPSNFWDGLLAGLNSLTVAGAGALVLLGILLPWLVIAAIVTIAIVMIGRASRKRRASRAAQPAQQAAPAEAALAEVAPAGAAPVPSEAAPPQAPPGK